MQLGERAGFRMADARMVWTTLDRDARYPALWIGLEGTCTDAELVA